MTNEQNDQIFNSIFGDTEPYKETMELNGKTYKIEGYRTPVPNNFCALASEKSLSKDWTRPGEDEAWKDL